jgi:hypothetical protein
MGVVCARRGGVHVEHGVVACVEVVRTELSVGVVGARRGVGRVRSGHVKIVDTNGVGVMAVGHVEVVRTRLAWAAWVPVEALVTSKTKFVVGVGAHRGIGHVESGHIEVVSAGWRKVLLALRS